MFKLHVCHTQRGPQMVQFLLCSHYFLYSSVQAQNLMKTHCRVIIVHCMLVRGIVDMLKRGSWWGNLLLCWGRSRYFLSTLMKILWTVLSLYSHIVHKTWVDLCIIVYVAILRSFNNITNITTAIYTAQNLTVGQVHEIQHAYPSNSNVRTN